MGQFLSNTYRLGVKELWSLWRDRTMLVLIVYVFTLGVYTGATAMPETLHNAPIAVVDEDQSPLSQRIISALYPPPVQQAAVDRVARDGRGDGRGTLHVRDGDPAQLPA